jgi:hypothetical protein
MAVIGSRPIYCTSLWLRSSQENAQIQSPLKEFWQPTIFWTISVLGISSEKKSPFPLICAFFQFKIARIRVTQFMEACLKG